VQDPPLESAADLRFYSKVTLKYQAEQFDGACVQPFAEQLAAIDGVCSAKGVFERLHGQGAGAPRSPVIAQAAANGA
jgi:hypothetical protein